MSQDIEISTMADSPDPKLQNCVDFDRSIFKKQTISVHFNFGCHCQNFRNIHLRMCPLMFLVSSHRNVHSNEAKSFPQRAGSGS